MVIIIIQCTNSVYRELTLRVLESTTEFSVIQRKITILKFSMVLSLFFLSFLSTKAFVKYKCNVSLKIIRKILINYQIVLQLWALRQNYMFVWFSYTKNFQLIRLDLNTNCTNLLFMSLQHRHIFYKVKKNSHYIIQCLHFISYFTLCTDTLKSWTPWKMRPILRYL